MTAVPIRVGRDIVTVLNAEPDVELFAAVTSESERELLGLPIDHTLLVAPMDSIRRVLHSSRIARSFVKEFQLDILQVESMPIPRRADVPAVVSLHDLREFDRPVWRVNSFAEIYRRTLLPRQARNSDAILSLTEWMKTEIERRFSTTNVHVIPPISPNVGIPPEPSVRVAGAVLDQPFVLTLGHLEPRKNVDVLVKARGEPTWPPSLGLVVAGADHGPSLRQLQKLANTSSATTTFLGPVSERDKWWLLAHAEIVAVPSLLEGFGIVALEAILAGTPVLVADTSALPEVVGNPLAVLPPDDHEAWSQRIRELARTVQ